MLRRIATLGVQQLASTCSQQPVASTSGSLASEIASAAAVSVIWGSGRLPWLHGAPLSAVWREAHQLAARRKDLRSGSLPSGMGKKSLRATIVQYPHHIQYYAPRKAYVYDLSRDIVDKVELPGDIFNVPVRLDILQRVVRWQRAKRQQGTHKTKNRAEVRGGGRKPWRQKGLGKARQGSTRSPQWRGGGVAHGPVPRSHAHKLPKKVRRLGLKCALSAKAHEGRLMLVDSLALEQGKTKVLAGHLEKMLEGQPRRSVLLIDEAKDGADGGELLRRAAGNLPGVEVVPQIGANVYSILRRDVLVMTVGAAERLVERLRRPINRLGASGLAYQLKLRELQARRAAMQAAEAAAAATAVSSFGVQQVASSGMG